MRIFFDTLKKCKNKSKFCKKKQIADAVTKVFHFMMRTLGEEKQGIFFIFNEDGRLKVTSENEKKTMWLDKSIDFEEFCMKCEEVYFRTVHDSEHDIFDMHYIVQIKETEEEDKMLLASPEAMVLEGINEYYGLRLKVKK